MSERWERVEELLEAALRVRVEERAAFLRAEVGGDEELWREVLSLLAADEAAGSFLGGGSAGAPAPAEPGERLGPYEILHEIGRGGSSVVYLARRADGEFEQRVAIKVLRTHSAGRSLVGRFATERRILASLEHPGLARMYDAGTTKSGLPYFAMEHIEGIPIDQYAANQALTVRGRLELFCRVCSAVHFAHQRLVVHRDIKPANLLVTAEGVPKLLDFGIAKLLDPEAADTAELTSAWVRVLTPNYASPEQVQGKPLTTASDVYSLGVLLYLLLAGKLPHQFHGASHAEVERTLREAELVLPSRVAGAPARELAGDLDNIVLRALATEPEARYGSAAELADDIERHLNGLPVRARAASVPYRLGKFVRRHRLPVAIAAASLVLLLALTAALAVQADRLREERNAASRERDKAHAIASFLTSTFESADLTATAGREVTLGEVVDRAAAKISADLGLQPAVRGDLLTTLATVSSNLGRFEQAHSLATQALALRRTDRDDSKVAEVFFLLATIEQNLGSLDGAEKNFRAALALRQKLGPAGNTERTEAMVALGRVFLQRGHAAAAEVLFEQAVAERERVVTGNDERLADALMALGHARQKRGYPQAAEEVSRRGVAMLRAVYNTDRMELAFALSDLAAVLMSLEQYDESGALLHEADALECRLLGPRHQYRAMRLNNLAALANRKRDFGEAVRLYREALTLARERSGPDDLNLAPLLNGLGSSLTALGKPEEAEPLLRDGLRIRRLHLPGGHWTIGYAEASLGSCLARQRRHREAEALLSRGCASVAAQLPPGAQETRACFGKMADLYHAWGRHAEAERFRKQSTSPAG